MAYKKNFIRDVKWYWRHRRRYDFDGATEYYTKKGELIIQYDRNGVDGVKAFWLYDSQGKVKPTKHPNILKALLKTKGSINLHIKMYAEDRANGLFPLIEFRGLCIKLGAPDWFRRAVEAQKDRILRHGV